MASDSGLVCQIRRKARVAELARTHRGFGPLRTAIAKPGRATPWNIRGETWLSLDVLVLGKTGYGKSTLLNALTGEEVFQTSDVEACTREVQSAEFLLADGACSIAFTDFPGIGETDERDQEYRRLYDRAAGLAHMIIYVLRADQRDFHVDERAFQDLELATRKAPLIVALNCIDKISPTNRSTPFRLSEQQETNLALKIASVTAIFDVPIADVIPISAIEGVGLNALASRITRTLGPHLTGT